ncbi:hypothetical protein ROZALSC1DRAFT_31271, partial [Rozella allomycis CSF55]
ARQGIEDGISQISKKTLYSGNSSVWNFPIDLSLKSTQAHGWPRIVISVYGLDALGRDVIRGYGMCHLPLVPGREQINVPLFVPRAGSLFGQVFGILSGRLPEFVDPRFVANYDDRDFVRTESYGSVKISVETVFKDFDKFYCFCYLL